VYRHLWSVSWVLLVSQVKEVQIVPNRSPQQWKPMDVRPGNLYIPQFPTTQQELKIGIRDACVNNDQNILKTCGRRCNTECSVLELLLSLTQKFTIVSWSLKRFVVQVSLVSCTCGKHFNHLESPHPQTYPVTAAVFRDTIKETKVFLTLT